MFPPISSPLCSENLTRASHFLHQRLEALRFREMPYRARVARGKFSFLCLLVSVRLHCDRMQGTIINLIMYCLFSLLSIRRPAPFPRSFLLAMGVDYFLLRIGDRKLTFRTAFLQFPLYLNVARLKGPLQKRPFSVYHEDAVPHLLSIVFFSSLSDI